MYKLKFLGLGHPRSGTTFTVKLLQKFGFDVRHERIGEDGMVNWTFAVQDSRITEEDWSGKLYTLTEVSYEYLIMNIRKPIDIISSTCYTESKNSKKFRGRYVGFNGLGLIERTVKSVVKWYRLIEDRSPDFVLKVDCNPEEDMYDFLVSEGEDVDKLDEKISRNVNSREHKDLNYRKIEYYCSQKVLDEYKELCDRYGYSYE